MDECLSGCGSQDYRQCDCGDPVVQHFDVGETVIVWDAPTSDPREAVVVGVKQHDGMYYYQISPNDSPAWALYDIVKPDNLLRAVGARMRHARRAAQIVASIGMR